jgi:hypothetical protein
MHNQWNQLDRSARPTSDRSSMPWIAAGLLAAASVLLNVTLVSSAGANPNVTPSFAAAASASAAIGGTSALSAFVSPSVVATPERAARTEQPHSQPSCTFNGVTTIVPNVTPGSSILVACSGWIPDEQVAAAEFSPLLFQSNSVNDIDPNAQIFNTDAQGNLNATFVVPNPFSAPDPNAVCPTTAAQVAQGFLRCGLVLVDQAVNGSLVALSYGPPVPPPPASARVVGMAATPDGGGYWLAWSTGNVTNHGDAQNFGDASQFGLNQPIAHIVSTPDGKGYWLVAGDGGTFAFGDAGFHGSMGSTPLNKPVVDMAPTADGKGYWLVASDGGIFAFGDAHFKGSMGGQPLNRPVVGIAADDATGGYWEVATDGGIFAIGAPFFGSTGAIHLNQAVNGMTPTPNDHGYWFVASDGGIFACGNAKFWGSMGGGTLNAPVVGMATDDATGGYWLVGSDGGIFSFHAPFYGAA